MNGHATGSRWRSPARDIPYEQAATHLAPERRLVEAVRDRYRRDDLTALLPLGDLEPMALPGENYQLALTPGLVAHVFTRTRPGQPDEALLPDPAAVLEGMGDDQGGYVAIDGAWWVPGGLAFHDPAADAAQPASTAAQELATARRHFFVPRKVVDPFGQRHDRRLRRPGRPGASALRPVRQPNDRCREQCGRVRVRLPGAAAPTLVTDPNGNRKAAGFDALGMVVATAHPWARPARTWATCSTASTPDPMPATRQAFAADPLAEAAALLGNATTRIVYDVDRFQRSGQPAFAAEIAGKRTSPMCGAGPSRLQLRFAFTDGFGRQMQEKRQAEPGLAPQRQPAVISPEGDTLPATWCAMPQGNVALVPTAPRWVGSGRLVLNNKGKPVRKYEPFFSATHLYEPERELADTGVSPTIFYDPIGSAVAVTAPEPHL